MNKKRSIVITGASSGLGECLSKSFSKRYDVINISRTISSNLHNIISNFSDLKSLKEKLKTKKLNHELCILNAGTMGEIGFASDVSDEDFLDTLKINIVANKIIIDWSILNGCKNFIGISSGAARKNYDGWLNYCVSKSAFRSMFHQYQKDLPKLKFKLISPGILSTKMNKKIKAQNISLYPEMKKFHETIASPPQKASELIYRKYRDFFKSEKLEFDLRDEEEC